MRAARSRLFETQWLIEVYQLTARNHRASKIRSSNSSYFENLFGLFNQEKFSGILEN